MPVRAEELSDEVLAAQAASGDDSAFETLVVRYQHRVFRLACRLTSETDAPDVIQETFLELYRHLGTFRGGAQFGTWLYRIATNAGLMHRRARARRPAESLEEFLPRFDGEGKLEDTPDALRIACRADYMEGALAPDVRTAIEAHVAGCPRCEAFIASYCQTPRIIRDATQVEMPADLEASLLAALRASRRADA